MGLVFKNTSFEEMNHEFVDRVIRQNQLRLSKCLAKYGELGCFYMSDARDGKMEVGYLSLAACEGTKCYVRKMLCFCIISYMI